MEVKLLELFAGIGGFAKGIQDAGHTITEHWFSETNKHCIANYYYNFKNAKYAGAVQDVDGRGITPNIITFGSPCQDFSLAGNRLGMEGQRSVLILEAIKIIRQCRPAIFIWENVKGAFSSNAGADFWGILAAFAHIGGYRLEWQLCNTNWFLPQNRERIYLVGHLAGKSEPGVFPLQKAGQLYSGKKRPEKSGVANCLDANYAKGWLDKGQRTHIIEPIQGKPFTNTLRTGGRRSLFLRKCFDLIKIKPRDKAIPSSLKSDKVNTITQNSCYDLIFNDGGGIRRLTEIECERLQGFPDEWTKYGNYNGKIKPMSKTQRYGMLGNAATTNVVRAIAERLSIHKNSSVT